ncbi:hypothetical protein NED98_19810 [Sphingomonas sp. MMSM20]|uniref:hypothetical protein n=1 Tax=Sphingomonas lycopersici TaxID=2951807 RepID=UPI0022385F35|nr:hypothetical protein [Sphingomonas lycopersici]MCW6532501.1 hypothetical protein [Sphingomonas lycopersici]
MSAQMDLDSPIDVLMTTRGQSPCDDPNGPGSLAAAYLARVPEYPAPREQQFQAELEMLTRGYMPGSLTGKIPNPVYVFSRGKTPDNPLEMAKIHYTKSLFVVSNRVKKVLETIPLMNSEFYPVSMVYSTKGVNSEDYGGGPVVAGTHWMWWSFATFDLVDVSNTDAVLTPLVEENHALPDKPMARFYHVGGELNGKIKVALKDAPYLQSAAFTILGWPRADMVVSPEFVKAFTEAGLVDPDGPIPIGVLPLDETRYPRLDIEFRKGLIPRKPLLRIFGTNIFAIDRHDPPFHASRSPYFPLPAKNS